MSKSTNASETQRSIRHQEILEIAAEKPERSMEDIAAEVPSATTSLVERVLDEYGDPATDSHEPKVSAKTEEEPVEDQNYDGPDEDEHLTDAELEVLRAIHSKPAASQRTLAESLDLSAATISKRAKAIDGLEWDHRESFVREFFDANPNLLEEDDIDEGNLSVMRRTDIDGLRAEIDLLNERIDSLATEHESSGCFEDPELAHKVIHACMQSEEFSSDEELAVIRSVAN